MPRTRPLTAARLSFIAMPQQLARHPMPVDRAIQWKPLRDPHYVLASLRHDRLGPSTVFVRQRVLARIEALAHATQHRYVVGLLLGQQLACTDTGATYAVVDTISELPEPVSSASAIGEALAQEVARHAWSAKVSVLGWYTSADAVPARPTPEMAALHAAHFGTGWQMMLVVSNASSAPAGALFAYDKSATRFYHLPFYELASAAAASGEPKKTCLTWPQYMTTEAIARGMADDPISPPKPALGVTSQPSTPTPLRSFWRSLRSRTDTSQAAQAAPSVTLHRSSGDHDTAPARRTGAKSAHTTPPSAAVGTAARRQSTETPKPARQIGDNEDTALGETVDRYLDLARSEGFFVAARFDSRADTNVAQESLWILNDPFSGLLLTVAARGSEIIDANLHYNLHTDDERLLQRTFHEHRDLDSRTIYVREACVEQLRGRCRRLRSTNALVRTWTVAPPIHFLTPAEWLHITDMHDDLAMGAEAIRALDESRIGVLGPAVRSQFRLGGGGSDTDTT